MKTKEKREKKRNKDGEGEGGCKGGSELGGEGGRVANRFGYPLLLFCRHLYRWRLITRRSASKKPGLPQKWIIGMS